MENLDIANVAAILEDRHDFLNKKAFGDPLDEFGLKGYTVVSTGTFSGEPYTKAITVKDSNGNVYVHYYGTGDDAQQNGYQNLDQCESAAFHTEFRISGLP